MQIDPSLQHVTKDDRKFVNESFHYGQISTQSEGNGEFDKYCVFFNDILAVSFDFGSINF